MPPRTDVSRRPLQTHANRPLTVTIPATNELGEPGLTQMGREIARRVGLTKIGRAQGKHYPLFTGEEPFTR